MELSDAIHSRRSVRAFREDPVPEAVLRDLVELANWAPSAGNLQSRDFVVVRDGPTRAALARAALDQDFIAQAPAVVVVCGNARRVAHYGRRGRDLYMIQDAAAATQNLLLAAHARGLGGVWVGAFDEVEVRRILHLPEAVRPLALVPLGAPAGPPEGSDRLPAADLLHWDRW